MEVSLASIGKLFDRHQHFILTPHIHPDGDCLGSMLALYHYLISRGKKVEMLLDDAVPASFSFFPGVDLIKHPQGVESADLLVVLDSSDAERLGRVKDQVVAPILNIDHHLSNTHFADYWLVDSTASATAEIVYGFLKSLDATITSDMAVCLYTGIVTDSGSFRYASTSPKTMRYGAELIEYGAKPHIIADLLETRTIESLTVMAEVLRTLEFYDDSQIAALTISPEIVAKGNDYTEGLINYPRSIDHVEIAVVFKIVDNNTVRISMRSKSVDVSAIAVTLGGGGHARAAGCTFNGSIGDAKRRIIELAADILDGPQ
jgi:phosphoesterase RecJ-like protein